MWYGVLYSIMALGIVLNHRATILGQQIPAADKKRIDQFSTLAASAMALADMAKPQRYGIECAILYVETQYRRWGRLNTVRI
jgi:hypothetical protein